MAFFRGTDGNDTISTGGDNDTISGGAGTDRLNGGYGDDHLKGGSGDDVLTGGVGNDRLEGNSGNDVFTGSAGDDEMLGGYGADEFVFTAFNYGGDVDYIADMRLYEGDILRLKNGVFVSSAEVSSTDYNNDFVDNDAAKSDLKVTLTDPNSGATQTVWILDFLNNTDTLQVWDQYLTSQGYSGLA